MTALALSARYEIMAEETGSIMKWSRAAGFRESLEAAMIVMMRSRCLSTVLKYDDVSRCSIPYLASNLLEVQLG